MATTPFAASDGTPLVEYGWDPPEKARGRVVLLHGYGEHMGRYDHVGKALAQAGWTVRGADLRGHGRSGGARGFCSRFDEFVDDTALLIARTPAGPGPLFVLGHSFGGLVATHLALRRTPAISGLLLTSPFFGLALAVPAVKVWLARLASSVRPGLSLPSGLRGVDVSRDPRVVAEYDRDPLNNKNATARWFTETRWAQERALARAGELTLPCLVIQGAADKVADPACAEAFVARLGADAKDKTLSKRAGAYHEVLNEPEPARTEVLTEVTAWLAARGSCA